MMEPSLCSVIFLAIDRESRCVRLRSSALKCLIYIVVAFEIGPKNLGFSIENPCVGGSIPPRATKKYALNQMVTRFGL